MGNKNINQMVTELQRRITQLNFDDAFAAINNAIEWIWNKGSYTFQLTGLDSPTISFGSPGQGDAYDVINVPLNMDMGKAVFLANQPQGTPIEKKGIQEFGHIIGLNIPANKGYSVYIYFGRQILLRPPQPGGQSVSMRYHIPFVQYTTGQQPPTPSDFDDAIISLAEARERRIYDVGDSWPKVQEDAEKEIVVMLNAYRSVSQEPMSGTDAAVAAEERTKLGHA